MTESEYQHTLKSLSKATGISQTTLRTWRHKGWLRPSCITGVRERYDMQSFQEAKQMSLKIEEQHDTTLNPGFYRNVLRRYQQL